MSKNAKTTEIVLSANSSILFGKLGHTHGNMLFIGNFNGVCGDIIWKGHNCQDNAYLVGSWEKYQDTIYTNVNVILETIKNGYSVVFAGSNDSIMYWKKLIYYYAEQGFLTNGNVSKSALKKVFSRFHTIDTNPIYENAARLFDNDVKTTLSENEINKRIKEFAINNIFNKIKETGMKFNNIIQNPPYNKSLHLDFLEKGLELLDETGRMVIVEPATWLINLRKYGKRGEKARTNSNDILMYDAIKKKLNGHIESVVIENLNKEFDVTQNVPFATTTIDMSKTFDTIDCIICGEHKVVESIYDINLVGKYDTIWSILDKVQKYGDMMDSRITTEDKGNKCYSQYNEIVGSVIGNHNIDASIAYTWDSLYESLSNGTFYNQYTKVALNANVESLISDIMPKRRLAGGGKSKIIRYSDKNADCIYGTKTELENWKHFIFNNKLPLFINIVMTIDQHNNSKEFLPWLVDKQYTDEEIYKMFEFTPEEIALIEKTIKKYERNSPWFKRYMCGKDAVTDEEVNNFVQSLEEFYA